jgi:hypothetical protein
MQMRASIQIQSMLRALNDVVLPAVDPANGPAREQLQLTMGMLTLMAQQLPLQFRFDCDELTRWLTVSRRLRDRVRQGADTQASLAALARHADAAADTLERARATPDDVYQCVRELRAAIGELVTLTYRDGDADERKVIADIVLGASQQQLLRDRALLLMQGWEPDPDAIPPIADLLDPPHPIPSMSDRSATS